MYLGTAIGAPVSEGGPQRKGVAVRAAPAVAHQWVAAALAPQSIPAFFVNLDRDEGRRTAIEGEIAAAALAAERISAVNGLSVPDDLRSYFFTGDAPHSRLGAGEIGCYASHLKALKLVVERGLGQALILEDDALLPADLPATLARILASLPADWDVVHLSADPCRAVKPLARLDEKRTLVRYSRVPAGTVGYLISQAGARKFLQPSKRMWPVDTDFRRPWAYGMEIYGVTPRVIGHSSVLPATITHRSRRRRGIPIPSLQCSTGNPLHSVRGALFNIRTLGLVQWASCLAQNSLRRTLRALRLNALLQIRPASFVRART